ncbi:hypothetical protein [Streptomyces triculaminicus]|uniref:hypothetical protein n=1 Tax=Streptomyces triculaminicus TaxID=2816232 RepID=UPI0037D8D128
MPALSAMCPTRAPRPVRRFLLACAALLACAGPAAAAPSPADPPSQRCGDPVGSEFPITSRLSGGPGAYERGGTPHTWRLELHNDTDGECRSIHPVAVLADKRRALQPGHVHLDFYDQSGSRWLPVRLEHTDEAENVGVLGDTPSGFPGFAVPPHGFVTVQLRLGFTAEAPEGAVTANVTAVQKRGADGAWVGESDDYTFAVGPARATPASSSPSDPSGSSAADVPRGPYGPSGGPADAAAASSALADSGDERPVLAMGLVAWALLAAGTALLIGARLARGRLLEAAEAPAEDDQERHTGTDR